MCVGDVYSFDLLFMPIIITCLLSAILACKIVLIKVYIVVLIIVVLKIDKLVYLDKIKTQADITININDYIFFTKKTKLNHRAFHNLQSQLAYQNVYINQTHNL